MLFELMQEEVQYKKKKKKKNQIFLSQEARAFGNDIEKEPQKPHPNLY